MTAIARARLTHTLPSSTLIVVPVTASDAGDTRYSSVESSSAGSSSRLRGKLTVMSPIRLSMPSIISEAKAPGAMQLTLMWKRDHSTASVSVMRWIAIFVIE